MAEQTDKQTLTGEVNIPDLTEEEIKKQELAYCSGCIKRPEKQESWWLKNRKSFFIGAAALTGLGILIYLACRKWGKSNKDDESKNKDLQKQGIAKSEETKSTSADAKTTQAQKTQANQKSTGKKLPGTDITTEPSELSQTQLALTSHKTQNNLN